ncbi:hypothetical protein OF83DRAFT_1088310 [Amylostereum chailletii]|nr:hypothetical protein OF83DRAFT_1088310 [Amylostereum chailletii]
MSELGNPPAVQVPAPDHLHPDSSRPSTLPYDPRSPEPILMGVSGYGKSSLGKSLATALAYPFLDADDLHPPSNVAKMNRGEPLTDVDRAPWLVIVRDGASLYMSPSAPSTSTAGALAARSALKRRPPPQPSAHVTSCTLTDRENSCWSA